MKLSYAESETLNIARAVLTFTGEVRQGQRLRHRAPGAPRAASAALRQGRPRALEGRCGVRALGADRSAGRRIAAASATHESAAGVRFGVSDREHDDHVICRGTKAGKRVRDRRADVGASSSTSNGSSYSCLPTAIAPRTPRRGFATTARHRLLATRASASGPESECSPRRRATHPSVLDSPRFGIDVGADAANEPAQREGRGLRRATRRGSTERRRRRDRGSPRPRPSARARTRAGRSRTAPRRSAAAGSHRRPSRSPCPSRCGGRHPRAQQRSPPSRRKARLRGGRPSPRRQPVPHEGAEASSVTSRSGKRSCDRRAPPRPRRLECTLAQTPQDEVV